MMIKDMLTIFNHERVKVSSFVGPFCLKCILIIATVACLSVTLEHDCVHSDGDTN